jgi:ABC-type transport system involved in multi-copper enzyme maturation permease subunit
MKIFDIALKDMRQSFRSIFGLVFMFAIPLLVPLLFALMMGGSSADGPSFQVPVTKVIIVNQDQGGPEFEQAMAGFPAEYQADSLGGVIVNVLQSPDFANLLEVRIGSDPAAARRQVDSQEVGVALVIPTDFSASFSSLDRQAVLEFYQDPTLAIGPGIVKSILSQFMDNLSGARIAVQVTLAETGASDPTVIGQVVAQYLDARPQGDQTAGLLEVRSPGPAAPKPGFIESILGPIMGAMLIFYAYYTGVASAQSILREDEQRTLPRLFTTPTAPSAILTGKFLAVFLTVTAQVLILLTASHFLFRIRWGDWSAVTLLAISLILNAASFGIFLNSLLKNSRQGGVVFGGVLSLTSMIGMVRIFAVMAGGVSPWLDIVSLVVPQGWAVRLMLQGLDNALVGPLLASAGVLLAWTVVFFLLGIWRFGKRYA